MGGVSPTREGRRWSPLALLVALVLVIPTATSSGSSYRAASAFWDGQSLRIEQPVEQQSPNWFYNGCGANPDSPACDPSTWVTNPTVCTWDVDDFQYVKGAGSVAAARPQSVSRCLIADGTSFDGNYGNNKTVSAAVTSTSAVLVVTLTNTLGASWTAVPVADTGGYRYALCTVDTTPGPYPPVPGSNGGHGIRVDYTLTIIAAKNAKVSNAELYLRPLGCP